MNEATRVAKRETAKSIPLAKSKGDDLEKMKKKDLILKAIELGIEIDSKDTKDDIIAKIGG